MNHWLARFSIPAWLWAGVVLAATTLSIPAVLTAIQRVESGGNPYAIRDNSANRVYFPNTLPEAIAKAKDLLALGHNLDLGLMQINSVHLKRPGVRVETIFDPANQASLGAQIFDEFYTRSKAINGDTDTAVWRAVGAYNLGVAGLYRDHVGYINRVAAAMGLRPLPDIGGASAQGGSGRARRSRMPTLQTPGDWEVGETLGAAPNARARTTRDPSPQRAAAAVAIVILVLLGILLLKVGLLLTAIKFLAKLAVRTAARQLLKRRRISA